VTTALSFSQIVTLACQAANVQGFTSQAGQLLNAILEELAQTYDFEAAQAFTSFNFNTSLQASPSSPYYTLLQPGSGPYQLPTSFLRAEFGDVFWTLQGVPYPMTALDQAEFDMTVQQPGFTSYPYWYTVDMSPLATGAAPNMFVYPPPSGNYPVYVRFKQQMGNTANPQTSSALPWFPSSTYLFTRLAGEMMKLANDPRSREFLGKGPEGAQGILARIMPMLDNPETHSKRVQLDRRRFGSTFNNLPNTKRVGW